MGLITASNPPSACLLTPTPAQDRGEKSKSKKKGKKILRVKRKTVKVMARGGGSSAKAVAHHLPQADQCPTGMSTLEKLPHNFIGKSDIIRHALSIWSVWISCQRITENSELEGCPLTPLAHPQPALRGRAEGKAEEALVLCSTAQE